jgi:hypothetical protein
VKSGRQDRNREILFFTSFTVVFVILTAELWMYEEY